MPPSAKTEVEPYGVTETVTPIGWELYFQSGPKRLYRIDGEEVPSITQALDILGAFGAGAWWGQGIGIAGAGAFYRETRALEASDAAVLEWMRVRKLTTNHTTDKAADRGSSVHAALEAWADAGAPPLPSVYPEEHQGWVSALLQFVTDTGATPLMSEVMVGHKTDGFAGRFDLLAKIPKGARYVEKTFPKRDPVYREVDRDENWLIDLKTKSEKGAVLAKYHLQVAAYETAFIECGYGAEHNIDRKGILIATVDGRYMLVEGKAQYRHFLAVKGAFDAMQEVK